jgi:glycerol-3-phosphate acyltransferase PlsX
MKTVIAVDAMGSDRAPKPEVEGAILAARSYNVHVLLVGKEDVLKAEMRNHPSTHFLRNIEIVHADEVISMEDKAAQAVRSKKKSSMHVGLRLVREGKALGFATAGNTGAAMATAKMILGALPGVDRPGLAAVFPTSKGTAAILLDVGANVDSKPQNLEQFAIMGEIYSRFIFSNNRPRVGLLSVGEEEGKGNDLTKESYKLLKPLPINFIGNVEGRDLYNGHADVIVCDGFVGNVALKISEGLVEAVRYLLKESLRSTISSQVARLFRIRRSATAGREGCSDHRPRLLKRERR